MALRTFVFKNAPALEETFNPWGNPAYNGRQNVCWILAYRDHEDFGFFRGTELPDPEHLLEGTGKRLRHVKIRSLGDVDSKPIQGLLLAALKLDAAETRP